PPRPAHEDDGRPRTRGGWDPVGTAGGRRAVHAERGTARGPPPPTPSGHAARRVFERDGYVDANVDGIVAEAGVSRGSFYTYFPSKREVFRELAAAGGGRVSRAGAVAA